MIETNMTSETVIYEFSGVTLNEEKLYKRVVLDKTITISEKQFDEAVLKIFDIVQGDVQISINRVVINDAIKFIKNKLGF